MEVENVFKISTAYAKVREFLTRNGWEFRGRDEEVDSFRNKKNGRELCIEDISEDFTVTFLMGELSLPEFGNLARELTPGVKLLEVESSWEGKPSIVVVAMTKEQVRDMFGDGTKMRQIPVREIYPRH